jgi:hypothetical protein
MGGSPPYHRELYISLRHHASSSHCRRYVLSSNCESSIHFCSDTTSLLQTHFTQASEASDPDTLHPFQPVLGQMYQAFASVVHAVCTPYTTSPAEIATVCAAVWPLYISPILNDWQAANDRGRRVTRFRWEHPEGSRACGEERLQQLCRSYIHGTKPQRSGRGRTNRLSRSVWTTLPPIGC